MKVEVFPDDIMAAEPRWCVKIDGEIQEARWQTRACALDWVLANFPKRTLPVMLGADVEAALARLI